MSLTFISQSSELRMPGKLVKHAQGVKPSPAQFPVVGRTRKKITILGIEHRGSR